MHWLDPIFAPLPNLVTSLVLLAVVGLLAWRGTGRKLALAICIALATRYMLWRVLYTLNLDGGLAATLSLTLLLAETYGYFQLLLFSFQVWSPSDRESPPVREHPSVDLMVTVVDEPLYILERTLIGCLSQDYPRDRFEVHVLDDGHRPEVESLAAELGVSYLSRPDRRHAKAGNLNHALEHSSGELVAVFDVDHVPRRDFLVKTVGFFADPKVAIVQTAQGFYNQDIYQRSAGGRRGLHNEQDLFFRTVQAGRDRHNSAFFAGSSGVLRRSALLAIGGFQTETITEDIHTSLLLHAKGYDSCYLNEPMALGLMPETFEGHRKQRARWATGTAQVLVHQNPLLTPGLSWRQRLDYFGSVYYFLFGLPRVVFLAAPLCWLLLGIPALRADALALVGFFFPAYVASVLAMRLVSRRTRNAFWSDVHETVLCFTLTAASLSGLFSGRRPRAFAVTPKGTRSESAGFGSASAVSWHFGVLALLLLGLANGLRQWLGASPTPGLPISIGWASFNCLLLAAAIGSARDKRQQRAFVRRDGSLPCQVVVESDVTDARLLDVSESGAELRVATPLYTLEKHVRVVFGDEDELLSLKGEVVRQEREPEGAARIGVRFEDAEEGVVRELIARSFSAPPEQREEPSSGVLGSFLAMLATALPLRGRLRRSQRRAPRLPFAKPCRLLFEGSILPGTTRDISFSGVSATFPGRRAVESFPGVLSIEDVKLAVSPIESALRGDETWVRFRIDSITQGQARWRSWHEGGA